MYNFAVCCPKYGKIRNIISKDNINFLFFKYKPLLVVDILTKSWYTDHAGAPA